MKVNTALIIGLLVLSVSRSIVCQTETSSGVETSLISPPNAKPTLDYSISLISKPCLGARLVFKQKLTNISDHYVTVYPEYTQRAILDRAWDRSLTNLPWLHIPQFTQSFGDPVIVGDGPKTKQLAPKAVFSKKFRIDGGALTGFYYSEGKYSIQLTYTPPGKDAVSVESNELMFHIRKCSKR